MSEADIEMGRAFPERKGYVVWKGKTSKRHPAMMLSICGKEYFFSQRGNGWLAKVDLNDPGIRRALDDPDSMLEPLDTGDSRMSIHQMLVHRTVPQITEIIFNTTSREWLMQAYAEFEELEQNQLRKVAEERLAQLGVDPDGVPVGKKEDPEDEQAAEEAPQEPANGQGGGEGQNEAGDPLSLD